MSLLQDVCDIDNVVGFNPLALDFGSRVVRGADAIIRRVLYLWCSPPLTIRHAPGLGVTVPIFNLPAATFSPLELKGLRQSYEAQAKEVAFVDDAKVSMVLLPSGMLLISSTITLTDNKAYALELSVTDARVVLLRLGSQTS